MKLFPCLSQQCFGPVNMLSAEALHERWPLDIEVATCFAVNNFRNT